MGMSAGLAGLASGGAISPGQDWPQWRGPLANGVAPAANPPTEWSESKNVKWKVKLAGSGSATPIVSGDSIYIQSAVPTGKKVATAVANEAPVNAQQGAPGGGRRGGGPRSVQPTETFQFTLLCLDRNTGKTIWQKVAKEELPHEAHHPDHGFSSYSPITDGQLVFAYFGSRGLHCYDAHGNLKWQKDLGRMQTKMSFGEGSSPALHGDTLVINWDHEGADFIVAFDKKTGNELWRQPREEDTTWATPLIVEHGGKAEVITNGTKRVRSYDLATGKPLWDHAGLTPNVIPSPVAADGVVYSMSGFRGNALYAIRLGRTGDLTKSDAVVWSHNKSTPYVPSPLLYDDRLYFISNNNAVLSCFDAKTGKAVVEGQRIDDVEGVYASPVGAGGKVYVVGRNGVSAVLKHGGAKLDLLATNRLDDKFDASPAVAGNELFLRGREHLYCIAEKE